MAGRFSGASGGSSTPVSKETNGEFYLPIQQFVLQSSGQGMGIHYPPGYTPSQQGESKSSGSPKHKHNKEKKKDRKENHEKENGGARHHSPKSHKHRSKDCNADEAAPRQPLNQQARNHSPVEVINTPAVAEGGVRHFTPPAQPFYVYTSDQAETPHKPTPLELGEFVQKQRGERSQNRGAEVGKQIGQQLNFNGFFGSAAGGGGAGGAGMFRGMEVGGMLAQQIGWGLGPAGATGAPTALPTLKVMEGYELK